MFTGSHTGEHILRTFETIATDYGITEKLRYIITDNAANMKKAFMTSFPIQDGSGEQVEDFDEQLETNSLPYQVDDAELWEDVTDDVPDILSEAVGSVHLSCFAHSLQLVIKDGLKKTG